MKPKQKDQIITFGAPWQDSIVSLIATDWKEPPHSQDYHTAKRGLSQALSQSIESSSFRSEQAELTKRYQDEKGAVGTNWRDFGSSIDHLKLLDLWDTACLLMVRLIARLNCWDPHTSTVLRLIVADRLFSDEALLDALVVADRFNFVGVHHIGEGELSPLFLTFEFLSSVELAIMLRQVKDLFFPIVKGTGFIHSHFLKDWAIIPVP